LFLIICIKVVVFWLFGSRSLFSDSLDQGHCFLTVWIKVIVFRQLIQAGNIDQEPDNKKKWQGTRWSGNNYLYSDSQKTKTRNQIVIKPSVLIITQQDWFGVLSSSLQGHCFQTIWFLLIVFYSRYRSLFPDYLVPQINSRLHQNISMKINVY
jgi:hypothetical protein